MQRLLTIADLAKLDSEEAIAPFLEIAQGLHRIYFDYVLNSQNDTYKYKVELIGSKERAKGIHASEVSNCMRQLVYGIMGTERRPDPSTSDTNMLMRFKLGTAVHAMIQNDWHRIAKKTPDIRFQDEVRIHPGLGGAAEEWDIHSSCDGIITFLKGRKPYLRVGLEIKTESQGGYDGLKAPRPKHIEQTIVYMKTLDVPLMWVLYYNKSNSNITPAIPPYLYKFDDKLWSEDLEFRFVSAIHKASLNQLPDKTEGIYCKWCPFTYDCKPGRLSTGPAPISPGMWSNK